MKRVRRGSVWLGSWPRRGCGVWWRRRRSCSKAWTARHELLLRGRRFDQRGVQIALDAELEALLLCLDRRRRLDAEITMMAGEDQWAAVVRRLGCLRGVSTLTGFALAVEIGDWDRFTGATIGAYLGLVPTESSWVSAARRDRSPRRVTPM